MSQADRIEEEIKKFTERLMVKVSLDVSANLIEATPVDTGWARANWVSQVGSAPDTSGANPEAKPTESQVAAQGAKQETSQAVVAATYDVDKGSIYVSSGVGYMKELNNGTSTQAPKAFVQKAIKKAVIENS